MRLLWTHLVVGRTGRVAAGACGKKGPPLAPLVRVPAQVAELSAARAGRRGLPDAARPGRQRRRRHARRHRRHRDLRRDCRSPADARARPPASAVVAAAAGAGPSPGAAAATAAALAGRRRRCRRPVEPGLDQGQQATFRERLTPELIAAAAAHRRAAGASATTPDAPPSPPSCRCRRSIPATDRAALRFYAAARRDRAAAAPARGAPCARCRWPALRRPGPGDADLRRHLDALSWTPPPGARAAPAPPAEGLLPSRPSGPPPPATRYNVYAADAETAEGALGVVLRPAPLNPTPTRDDGGGHARRGVFGQERCFVVRSVDRRSPGSPSKGRRRRRPA